MKRYIFRLEPVLKLRRVKEEKCRTELGLLLRELKRIEDQLEHDRQEIAKFYGIQETGIKGGVKAGQIQTLPMLVVAKDANIKLLLRNKEQQKKLIDEKSRELSVLRGELKVIENLKEKDFDSYKKAYNKEMDQKTEDQTQNWLQHNRTENIK